MSQFQFTRFNYLPPVIKNLLIINGLVFLATVTFPELTDYLALYYPASENFRPYQFITHMFTHGSLSHVFFNMFSLWMFGAVLENVWGPKRFLQFFMITGIGAAVLYTGVHALQLHQAIDSFSANVGSMYTTEQLNTIQSVYSPTVGASGAIYAVLVAFGMLFPNTLIYVYLLLPVKAKYLIIVMIAIELFLGLSSNPGDNIAHLAHLSGALMGFLLIKFWSRNKTRFY